MVCVCVCVCACVRASCIIVTCLENSLRGATHRTIMRNHTQGQARVVTGTWNHHKLKVVGVTAISNKHVFNFATKGGYSFRFIYDSESIHVEKHHSPVL